MCPFHCAGAEVLGEDVDASGRGIDEVLDDLDGVGMLEVEGDRLLAPIDAEKVGRDPVDVGPGASMPLVRVDVFDLVDGGAQVGEDHRSVGAGEGPGEVEDA